MGAKGGAASARGSQGVELTGDAPNQQLDEGEDARGGEVARLPPKRRRQDPPTDSFESSQQEYAIFFNWLRGEASKFFRAGRVIALVLLPLVFAGYPALSFVLVYLKIPTIPDFFASMSFRRLAFFGVVVSSAIGILITAGYRLVRTITRTYRDMNQVDMKKTASRYVDDPATRARYVDNLLENSANRSPPEEASNDTDGQSSTSFLTLVRDFIRVFQNRRRDNQ